MKETRTINGKVAHIVTGKTQGEWEARYGEDTDLWDILLCEFEDGTMEIDEDIWYWLIGDRLFETDDCVDEYEEDDTNVNVDYSTLDKPVTKEELDSLFNQIKQEYFEQDNCMYDFLADRNVPHGMSFEQAMKFYATLMNESEDDQFIRFNADENWKEDLVTGERSELK